MGKSERTQGGSAMTGKFRPGSIIHYRHYPHEGGAFGIILRLVEPLEVDRHGDKWNVYWFDLKRAGTIFSDEIELVLR